jgi:hypothetical protein
VRYRSDSSSYTATVLDRSHRQGPVKAIYDSSRDGASYYCAPYIRSQYFTEAYRTLALFRTGSHDLAGTTGRWVAQDSSSSHEHRLCTQCCLHRIEDEVHFIFECPVYEFLRIVQNPDLFVGRSSLRSFMGQADQHRVANFIRDCLGHGHMYGHSSLEPLWLLWDFRINLSIYLKLISTPFCSRSGGTVRKGLG